MAPWIYCLPVHWPFSYWVACVFMTIIWGTYISNIFLVYPLLFICRLIISFKFIDGYMTFEFWGFLWRPSHAKTNENAFPPLIYWFLQINLLEMKYLLYLNFFFMLLARWPDCCRYSSYWMSNPLLTEVLLLAWMDFSRAFVRSPLDQYMWHIAIQSLDHRTICSYPPCRSSVMWKCHEKFCLTWRRFLYSYKFLFLYFIFSMFLIELELHHLPISLASLQLLPAALLTPSHVLHNSCYLLFLWLSLVRTSACLFVWISIYKYNLLSPFLLVVCTWFQCWLLYIGKPIRGSSLGEAKSPPNRH